MKRNLILRAISFILIIAVFTCSYLGAFAQDPDGFDYEYTEDYGDDDFLYDEEPVFDEEETQETEEAKGPAKATSELTSKRDATVRQYAMDDGSFYVLEYGKKIHYKENPNGPWLNIDNSLVRLHGTI